MDVILSNISSNFNALISEMNEQNYDKIRFASYRTACKVRFIQKKTSLYLVDLFSVIEIIRENDLHKITDINSEITVHQLYQMAQLLFLQLNKRLPRSQNIDINSSITNLLSFMIYANDVNQSGKINVLFVKIVFCTLSSSRFQEKLKYIFSQIIDLATGNIMMIKFCAFLKCLLQLACTVNESQFYQYDEQVAKTIFHTSLAPSLDLKSFIRLFYSTSSGPPPILSWFVIMHKMAQVEFVIHPIICSACSISNFTGFRYKCQKCYNFNLCQNCFWQGRSTGTHNADKHSCKEYLNHKSPSKQLSNSLKRSFRLKSSPKNKIELNDDKNYLNMNNNFQPNYNNPCNSPFNQLQDFDTLSNMTYDNVECSIDDTNQFEILPNEQMYYLENDNVIRGDPRMLNELNQLIANPQYIIIEQQPYQTNTWPLRQPTAVNFITDLNFELDDEHRLIAQYAASLANSNSLNSMIEGFDEFGNPIVQSVTVDSHLNDSLNDACLNEKLAECAIAYENKNRELMMEIMRLRSIQDVSPSSDYNSLINGLNTVRSSSRFSNSPVLSIKSQQDVVAIEELCYLKEKKNELENHLQTLLLSKEELKNQLQNTIKMSQNFQNLCSTPTISADTKLVKKQLEEDAIKIDQIFEETQDLLEEEMYQKSIQSHNDELNEEISKVQEEEQKLLEEKELLEDFDRLLNVEKTTTRLMIDNQLNQSKQISQFNNNDDEITSDDSITLHADQQGKLYNNKSSESNLSSNLNREFNDKQIKFETNNNSISGSMQIDKVSNYKIQNSEINQKETNPDQIELNEETMHKNILNRNIDLLLKQNNRKTENRNQQLKTNRINKYELVYGLKTKDQINSNKTNRELSKKQEIPLIKTEEINRLSNQSSLSDSEQRLNLDKKEFQISQLDKRRDNRLLNDNSIDEISEANNSQTNSISSGSYLKFDVKSQPLMSFQSIAYVHSNRLLNSNPNTHKLMNLGSSNTSSDLPMGKLGESLDDSSLDTTRIQDMYQDSNLSLTSSNTESIKSSDTDDCPTLVDEVNNASFDLN